MGRVNGIVLTVALLVLFGVLLAYAGLGFDHQVIRRWVVVVNTARLQVQKSPGTYHHSNDGIVAVSVVLGVVWVALVCAGAAFMRWAWKGYPGV